MSLASADSSLRTLYRFSGGDGGPAPWVDLLSANGNIYGATYWGGSNNLGTLFQFSPATGSLSTIVNFNWSNGALPFNQLIVGQDAMLYGTTSQGGTNGIGTVFRLDPSNNQFTSLVSFNASTGSYPSVAPSIVGSDGTIYATAAFGGVGGRGTVFKYSPASNSLTALASFSGPNGSLVSGLTLGADGYFYGTTEGGGIGYNGDERSGYGTVFKLSKNGDFTTLAFFNGSNGSNPTPGLIVEPDGTIYGTAASGLDGGRLFRISPDGTLSTLATFTGANGTQPQGGLISDSAGHLFGVTWYGGANNQGTVFRYSIGTGDLTTLFSFDGVNGGSPTSRMILTDDGRLIGSTAYGGNGYTGGLTGNGTLFEITGIAPVPEPGSAVLWLVGAAALAWKRRSMVRAAADVRVDHA